MVRTIARVEFTQLHRDGRFRVSLVIVFLLLIAALGAGWTHFRYVNEERRIAQQDARGVWLEQAEKNPHSAAHFGTYAFRPQMPLSLVDAGLDPYVGTTIYLEAHKQNESDFAPAQDRTALQRFGELTAATLLQSVFPLIIIFFTFSSFAGEREAGTLKQVLSLGVRSRDLVLGKFLGIATAFAVVLGPATILGVAALGLSAAGEASWLNYSRLLWMTGGYVLYLAATLAVALAVSAYARSSHLALIVLLDHEHVNRTAPRDRHFEIHLTNSLIRGILDGCTDRHPQRNRRPRSGESASAGAASKAAETVRSQPRSRTAVQFWGDGPPGK